MRIENIYEYREEVLQKLHVDYDIEDVTNFDRWREKVLEGLLSYEGFNIEIISEAAPEIISRWLDEHPEATTTVEDGAITEVKLADGLKNTINDSVAKLRNTYPVQSEHEKYKQMVRENLVSFLVRNNFSSCIVGNPVNDDYKVVYKYLQGDNYFGMYGAGDFRYQDTITVDGRTYHVAYFDCATFATLITRGRTFDTSPYAYAFSHNDATVEDMYELGLEDPDPEKNYTFDFLNNVGTSMAARIMNGSGNTLQLIKTITSESYGGEPDDMDAFNNLETGDLIWFGTDVYPDRYLNLGHVAIYVKDIEELNELAGEHNITFKPADDYSTEYGYIVEFWSEGDVAYQDKLIIHTLDYWFNTPRGTFMNIYMTKSYANLLNSNKQYSLVTGMYRLYKNIRFVNSLGYAGVQNPDAGLYLNITPYNTFQGGQPLSIKGMNIDNMSVAKYSGTWMPYNAEERDSVTGTFPIDVSNKFYSLTVMSGTTTGRGAKQILVITDKTMSSDSIVYIRQTGASSSEYGAWKKISISAV